MYAKLDLEVRCKLHNTILNLLLEAFIFFLVEKWIPLSRSETVEIGQKNKKNSRG
jgi:hypothetical protein